jgi:hypothetical protein
VRFQVLTLASIEIAVFRLLRLVDWQKLSDVSKAFTALSSG